MSLDFEKSISSLSNLDFWYKVTAGADLTLSDVPEIIRFRWEYFRDNWEQIRQGYLDAVEEYDDPKLFRTHIDNFTDFVASQRTSKSKRNPFDNDSVVARFYIIFDNTPINSVRLSAQERKTITDKKDKIRRYTRRNFLEIRSELQKERDRIADKVSATDPTYNTTFNRSPESARFNINNKELNKMFEIQEAIKAVDFILANSFSLENSTVDPFALARQNANNPDIDIATYNSGFLVKINYGEDLESLASRTLGDPNKWIDIAIANGLKPPYIDETGERISLVSNGSGNQINLPERDVSGRLNSDKLSIGQILLLQSDTQTFPEQRSIQSIRQVPVSGEIVVELDGDQNLSKYRIDDNAYVRVFKPNTVNSSFFVLIPSQETIDDALKSETPWFLQGDSQTEKRQKVDLSLSENGDLQFNSSNDLQLSFGITNSIQAVKLKMSVEQGELRRHSEYGLSNVAGLKNDNISQIRKSLVDSISAMISRDGRFSNIDSLDIRYDNGEGDANSPSVIRVDMTVRLAGSDQLIPISFEVNRG